MKSKDPLIIIDWHNLLFAAWFASQKDISVKPWAPLLRLMQDIELATITANSGLVVIAGESKKKLKRSYINPTYKQNRKKHTNDDFGRFKKDAEMLVNLLWLDVLRVSGAEADDVIASIVKQSQDKFEKIYVYSRDKDLYQLLSFDNVNIYKGYGKIYSQNDFINQFKFSPRSYIHYKSFVGDPSDGVQGVMNWGPAKTTAAIQDGSIEKIIFENFDEYNRAYQLLSLDYDLKLPQYIGSRFTICIEDVEASLRKRFSEEAVVDLLFYMRRFINRTFNT